MLPPLYASTYKREQVRAKAVAKYPDDVSAQDNMVKLNMGKWNERAANTPDAELCTFKATAYKRKGSGMVVPSVKNVLVHSPTCTVGQGTVKTALLVNDPGFRASVMAHGGKGKAKVMRTEAAKAGLGGDGVTSGALWRAQRKVRAETNTQWAAQWDEMGRYFARLKSAGIPASVDLYSDNTFRYAFVAFPAVHAALKADGRGVCSTDFGHMKHDHFAGLNATGIFQLGDGTLVTLWSALFAESTGAEDNWKWEVCAKEIEKAGMMDMYQNAVHFRDRHKGADNFERVLDVKFGM